MTTPIPNTVRCGDLNCRHPLTFHGGSSKGHCKALGCRCPQWIEEADFDMTTDEVAEFLGKGRSWVKSRAEDLGGVKVGGQWRFRKAALPMEAAVQ